MRQPPASDRLRRLLSIVPWVAARDGPTIDEVCTRFDVTREELLADLDVVFMVGLYPYTPDELVDVQIEDDRVWIRYAEFFRRPLRLTPEQGLALVAAASSLMAVPGADVDGPLARGLAKLAGVLGADAQQLVEVDLGPVDPQVLESLTAAARDGRAVRVIYYAYGRDQRSERTIEPYRVFSEQGAWYVTAHCRTAGGERIFRLDRIEQAELLDEVIERTETEPSLGVFNPRPEDPRVVLEVGPSGRWIAEQYPTESVAEASDGRWRVTLVVTARPWLERLLLRLGTDAVIVEAPDELRDAGREAARRMLSRYVR